MLRIKSVNAASYVTYVTGIEGEVGVEGGSKLNHFKFPKSDEVMEAYRKYRKSVNDRSELNVDLIKFNEHIKAYFDKTKAFKSNNQ